MDLENPRQYRPPPSAGSDLDGNGSTVTAAFPAFDADAESAAPTMGSDARDLPANLIVLFVDGDTMVRKLFFRAVRDVAPGWTIGEASNGEMAPQLAVKEGRRYGLIFMDMYMASVEKQLLGTETVREMRSSGAVQDSVICGFSANDMERQFMDAGADAGADAFLMKPFPCQKDQLGRELKRILFGNKRGQRLRFS